MANVVYGASCMSIEVLRSPEAILIVRDRSQRTVQASPTFAAQEWPGHTPPRPSRTPPAPVPAPATIVLSRQRSAAYPAVPNVSAGPQTIRRIPPSSPGVPISWDLPHVPGQVHSRGRASTSTLR